MDYRKLGRSDLNISRIGFGCMSLKLDQPENEKIIRAAIDLGINYFDTADLYDKGANEEFLGKTLKQKRSQIIIATKVGNQWRSDGSGWDWNPRRDYILKSVEESLKRLQTNYIDLYQLHGGTIDDPIEETIDAFEQLVKQGKIRYYGISSIRPNVIRYWAQHSNIVSVMMQYSLLDRRPGEECLPLLDEKNIGVVVRGSVAQGLLVDKPSRSYLNYSEEEVSKAAETIQLISKNHGTPAQTAIQFVLRNSHISSAVVGIRTMEQLNEAVNTFSLPQLSQSQIASLNNSLPINFYKEHR